MFVRMWKEWLYIIGDKYKLVLPLLKAVQDPPKAK